MANPYKNLPESAFWRPAVAQRPVANLGRLWSPKFDIKPEQKVVTFGSCFAQHIGRAMKSRGFNWITTEPPPPGLSKVEAKRFNYNVFSCRTSNIYTTSLLRQWTQWAFDDSPIPGEVWEQDGRFFDPFRPTIEPGGFASVDELYHMRLVTVQAFAEAIRTADYFVFTLGLTESWRNRRYGFEYQMCPGTVAGMFDSELHQFTHLDFNSVAESLRQAIDLMRHHNSAIRILLTVSPVPLTATNSGQHVLVATMEAKSLLRTVAGQIARNRSYVDYFPSYEIVSSPATQGIFFEPNKREVTAIGVDFVMDHFFFCLASKFYYKGENQPKESDQSGGFPPFSDNRPGTKCAIQSRTSELTTVPLTVDDELCDLVCEEELLAAFGPRA